MKRKANRISIIVCLLLLITGCTYNPFVSNNETTGSPTSTAIGAGVGAGSVALLGGTRVPIFLAGLGGGIVGYYVSTLRFDSGGVIQSGGTVYKIGDYVGIYIPTDKLFEPNTDSLLPYAGPILDSVVDILARYPTNNIVISGNTSGFSLAYWERQLSERRAEKVSAYLWNAGINQFKEPGTDLRKLNYVGYGDYFPIATTYTNEGLRQNSRIQIVSYPSDSDLGLDKKGAAVRNIGALNDDEILTSPQHCGPKGEC